MIRPFVSLVLAASTLTAVLPAQTSHHPPAAGIDTAGMDRSVKPGDNFFTYANGSWLARPRSRPTAAVIPRAPSSPIHR